MAAAVDTSLKVEGMDCARCAHRLGTALGRLEGVVKAEADHQAGRVEVRFDPDRVAEDQLRQRIRAAGFDTHEDGP